MSHSNGKCEIRVHKLEMDTSERTEHTKRVEKLAELVKSEYRAEDRSDRTVVFLADDFSIQRTIDTLQPHAIRTSVFTRHVLDNDFVRQQEKDSLRYGRNLVALCGSDRRQFERAALPDVKHYVFLEMPTSCVDTRRHLDRARRSGQRVRVDVIYSRFDCPDNMREIKEAMEKCGQTPPEWIDELCRDPEEFRRKQDAEAEELEKSRRVVIPARCIDIDWDDDDGWGEEEECNEEDYVQW